MFSYFYFVGKTGVLRSILAKMSAFSLLFCILPVSANADYESAKIQHCTSIPARLERLACFDALFHTPVAPGLSDGHSLLHSLTWQRAVNSESRGSEQSGFSLHYANRNDLGADIWMTAKAHQSNSKAAVILMLSCIDGISRVELALPNASDAGKAQITINGARGITRDWLSDDQGMVFQSARGLPAIDIIRVLMSSPSVTLRSDLQLIDKLKFDTSNLRRDITPLRKACRW